MLFLKSCQEVSIVQIDLLSLLTNSLHVLSQKSNIRTIKMGQNFVQTGHFWCHCWCTSAGTGRTDVTHRFHVSLGDSHFLFFEISDICHSQNYQFFCGKLRSKGCKSDMCIVYQKNALQELAPTSSYSCD